MSLVADASVLDDPAAMEGLIARVADPLRERWLDQVRRTGACRHPQGSGRGAVSALGPVRFLAPPSEPDVRVPAHPALHGACDGRS
jgi:hypothetical protein